MKQLLLIKIQSFYFTFKIEFEKIEQIGQGSYGKACIVKEKQTGLIYVRKLLTKQNKDEEIKDMKEVLILKHLNNKIHHYGLPIFKTYTVDQNSIGIIYEYINGVKLSDYLQECISRQKQNIYSILLPIQDIQQYLKFCHLQGICHNDIKPDQILIDQETNKLTLIDFGEAYDIQQETNQEFQLNQNQTIVGGNILFVPPELIQEDYNNRMSYQNLNSMIKYSVTDYLEQKESYIDQQRSLLNTSVASFSNKENLTDSMILGEQQNKSQKNQQFVFDKTQQLSFLGNYKFQRHHHLNSLFILHTSEDKENIWTYALSRLYHYSILSSQTSSGYIDELELPLEEETIEKDLQKYAIQFNMDKLTPQMLYKLNIAMGHDCFSLGMTAICMIFNVAFQQKTVIETKRILDVILQKINQQLNETLNNILQEHQEFVLFYQERNQKIQDNQRFDFKIAPGIMPQNMDLDLFLLIAGLVHCQPKVRISIQEALCCPFILTKQRQQQTQNSLDWDIYKSLIYINKLFTEQNYTYQQSEGILEQNDKEESNQIFAEIETSGSTSSF